MCAFAFVCVCVCWGPVGDLRPAPVPTNTHKHISLKTHRRQRRRRERELATKKCRTELRHRISRKLNTSSRRRLGPYIFRSTLDARAPANAHNYTLLVVAITPRPRGRTGDNDSNSDEGAADGGSFRTGARQITTRHVTP